MYIADVIQNILRNNYLEYESEGWVIYWDSELERISMRGFNCITGTPLVINRNMIDKCWVRRQNAVSFMGVVQSGAKFRFEYRTINSWEDLGYFNLTDFFFYLAEEYEEETIREILINGKFYIER